MLLTAVEGEAARELSPAIAWPTIALTAVLVPLHVGLIALGLSGAFSPWWLTLPLGVSAYLHYTPVHEAIHRNIVRSRRFDPANAAIGWWGALLTGMTWPLVARTHIAHHAHTNDERDPDIFVRGSLVRLIALAMLSTLTNLVPVPVWRLICNKKPPKLGYLDAWKNMPASEWRLHQAAHGLMCVGVWSAVALGKGEAAFALYVVPATIGRFLMGFLLNWLPHQPWAAGDRYLTTSLRKGRLLALFSVGHNMHLIHHLWPGVPFYRYRALYLRLAPVLHERGVELV
ncbi:MAG TPA: fatty acid desaturase [Sphingomonas sp.]|nr:fatty acid desaturase [Sphingomonas sp.]